MSLTSPDDSEPCNWPPRIESNLAFDSKEAKALLGRRASSDTKAGLSTGAVVGRAKVSPTGVELVDQATKVLSSPSVGRNLKALNLVIWAICILALSSLVTLLVLTVQIYRRAPLPFPALVLHCLPTH